MSVVNVTLGDGKKLNLPLGRQGENEVTAVVFDFSAWSTEFGSGTLSLSVQRHGDELPYAVTMTTSGTNATWTISDLDTAYKGTGEAQVKYTVGTKVKKSAVYKFTVNKSLGQNGEYPSPGQTWQEEIEDELADVKQDFNTFTDINLVFDNNGYITYSTGAVASNSDYLNTDFIDVSEVSVLRVKVAYKYSAGIAFYDENRIYISGSGGTNYGDIVLINVPSDAKYFRISKNKSYDTFVQMATLDIPHISAYGEKIDAVKNRCDKNTTFRTDEYVVDTSYSNHGINNGVVSSRSSIRVLTDYIELSNHKIGIEIGSGYQYEISLFDSSKTFITSRSWSKKSQEYEFPSAHYVRILFAKETATNPITISEAKQNSKIYFPFYWNVSSIYQEIGYIPIESLNWESGYFDETGAEISSPNRVRSGMIIAPSDTSLIRIVVDEVNPAYRWNIVQFNSDLTSVIADGVTPLTSSYYPIKLRSKYFRIVITDTTWSQAISPTIAQSAIDVSFVIDDTIPFNFDSIIETKKEGFLEYSYRDGLNIIFVTDTHMERLTDTHYANIDTVLEEYRSIVEMANNINVDAIIHGGDVIHGANRGKTKPFQAFAQVVTIFKNANCPVFFCRGNHDDNMYSSDATSGQIYTDYIPVNNLISIEEWLKRLVDPMKTEVVHDSENIHSSYYYYDFIEKKKRVIILDPYDYPLVDKGDGYALWCSETWNRFSDRQLAWLENEALNVESDTNPVIVLHGVLVDGTGETKVSNAEDVINIINTYNGTHSNKIYNVVYGHTHSDIYSKNDGVNFFCTGAGFITNETPPAHTIEYYERPSRTKYTSTEPLFDLYSINKSNVKRIRFGAGQNQTVEGS